MTIIIFAWYSPPCKLTVLGTSIVNALLIALTCTIAPSQYEVISILKLARFSLTKANRGIIMNTVSMCMHSIEAAPLTGTSLNYYDSLSFAIHVAIETKSAAI